MDAIKASSSLFDVVEIEVNSRCNRSCHYCPVSVLPIKSPSIMSQEIFRTLINNLARIGFTGRISYHRYSEPLLRKDLEDLVGIVTGHLPAVKQVLYTNGDLLSSSRYESLCEAGINQFIVTRHDGAPIDDRPNQLVLYPSDLFFTNRGGLLGRVDQALTLPCFAPSEMLIVAVNGDILLCYEDSLAENTMGNILKADIEDIWYSPRFVLLRDVLSTGKRSHACSLCSSCDNRAHSSANQSRFMETQRGVF